MRRHKNDAGQALLLMAFTMIVLMGFAGMGIDIGYLRYMRRTMQAATDSAALAGAAELDYGDVSSAARADAATNGFTNGSKNTTVTVNNPPLSGPNQGNPRYVEVIIAQSEPTFFMKLLGVYSHMVSTRAVAYEGVSGACIYALNPTASSAFVVSGSASFSSQCGILDNSDDSTAALVQNGGGCLTAKYIGVVGQFKNNSSCAPTPTPQSGIAPFSDPLAYLQPPSFNSTTCDQTNVSITGGTQTLYQGVYCGGIKITGGDVTFSPGIYIINGGGLSVSGGANVYGNGVTFYLTGNTKYAYKGVSITGGSDSYLIAPDSGTYAGILFFQDRSISSTSSGADSDIAGGSGLTVQGTLYFPTTNLSYSGTSTNSAYTILVADTVSITNNTYFPDTYSSDINGFSPVHSAVLVE
ncbi:MAG: pilus assembly protein TadG-related protein [Acidobacteria bacterium]|nr:pilus assembly protein TadG-related protein [Acidobacteriota bacterium]